MNLHPDPHKLIGIAGIARQLYSFSRPDADIFVIDIVMISIQILIILFILIIIVAVIIDHLVARLSPLLVISGKYSSSRSSCLKPGRVEKR